MRYALEPLLCLGVFFNLVAVEVLILLASEALLCGDVGDATDCAVPGRDILLGGCGNCPMLTVFRTVCGVGRLPLAACATDLYVGTSGVDWVFCVVGRADGLEGVLSLEGVCGRLFLAYLFWGTGGRGATGGSAAGRERADKDISKRQVSNSEPLRWPVKKMWLIFHQQKQSTLSKHKQV